MKAIRVLFASLLFGTALLAGAQDALRVDVPFDFHVRGTTLPAGTYSVTPLSSRIPGVYVIRGLHGENPIAVPVGFASEKAGASLSFRRYGDSYFLSALTTASGKYSVPVSKDERMTTAKVSSSDVTVSSR